MTEDSNMNHNKVRDEYKLMKVEIKSMNHTEVVNSENDVDAFWTHFFQLNGDKWNLEHFMKSVLHSATN